MEKKVFRSRISVLLIIFIFGVIITSTIPMFTYKTNGGYVLGGVLLFIIFIFSGMRYVILGNMLYCKMWNITTASVDIAEIVSVERTYNPLSSNAASLKRLYIYYRNGASIPFWLISPVREQEFIEDLKTINPNITVDVPSETGAWRIWDWDI